MIHVFILCAGSGDRWDNWLGIPKQLITFGTETLIERTARLVAESSPERMYCITCDSRISLPQYETVHLSHTDSLTETILATRHLWSDQNVFLLGDVFYSERAILRLFECDRRLVFLGRPWPSALVKCGHGEMFGMAFAGSVNRLILRILNRGLSHKNADFKANMWNLYQITGFLPIGSSRHLPHLLLSVDDYTNDIDTRIDYMRRKWLYKKIASTGSLSTAVICRFLSLLPKHYLGILCWWASTAKIKQ